VRTANALDGAGIYTVRQLLNSCPKRATDCQPSCCQCVKTAGQGFSPTCFLLDIPNFGDKTMEEVFKALERVGFVRQRSDEAEPEQQRVDPPITPRVKRIRRF
jgi:hypothetical protein